MCLLSSVTITFQNCVLIGSQYQELVIFLNNHCKTSKPQKPLIQICIIVTSSSVHTNNSILVFLGLIKSGCYSRYGLGLAHRLWNDSWNSKSSYGKLQRLTTTTPEQIFWCLGGQQHMCYFGNKQASWYFFEYQFCFV